MDMGVVSENTYWYSANELWVFKTVEVQLELTLNALFKQEATNSRGFKIKKLHVGFYFF